MSKSRQARGATGVQWHVGDLIERFAWACTKSCCQQHQGIARDLSKADEWEIPPGKNECYTFISEKCLAWWIFSWNPIFSCEFFCCKTKMRSVSRDNETIMIIFTHFQLSMKGGSNTLTRGRVKTKLPHNWLGYASEIWEGCILIWKETMYERGQRGIIPMRNGTLKKFYWGWMQQSSLMAQMFYFNMKIDSSLDRSIHRIVSINRNTR